MSQPVLRLLAFCLIVGALVGALVSWFIRAAMPIRQPIAVEAVRVEYRENGNWRVSENIIAGEYCALVVLERRFKDEVRDLWVTIAPVDSFPPNMGGGIARVELPVGVTPAWAEYAVEGSGLHSGIYTVVVTAARCESGFSGTYTLIAGVEYDFTERKP